MSAINKLAVELATLRLRRTKGGFEMARLYAATGESVAVVENGRMILTLEKRGARCLVVDPKDHNTLYVGTSNEVSSRARTVEVAGNDFRG